MDWQDYGKPKKVKGGIKASTQRGAFAKNWWARRWLNVLEALNLGGRLQRARTYARRGQVTDLSIEQGRVIAKVQGSRTTPYDITIKMKPIAGIERLAEQISNNPYVLAKLLSREMPQDIEQIFAASRVSLFPARASELHTECTCPDWSNPCKHIAAVYYLLGEEFDRDPFLIFRLRGIDIESLTAADVGAPASSPAPPVELSDNFWEGTRPEVDLTPPPTPLKSAARLRRLGNLPFWRGEQPLADSLEPAYIAASSKAMLILTEPAETSPASGRGSGSAPTR